MPKTQILVDAPQIVERLSRDFAAAKESIFLQAMTFEADEAGNQILDKLKMSGATDIRLLVDSYSRIMVSDRFVFSPRLLFNKEFRAEVIKTRRLPGELAEHGIRFRWTNPLGLLAHNYANRNHKKLIVIDGKVCYIGGLNFSDHNFAWHDCMVRIENKKIASFLQQDFEASWQNINRNDRVEFPGIQFHLLDGRNNAKSFEAVFDLLDSATAHILIETPYLSFPFFEPLKRARDRGVKVDLITPQSNNKKFMDHYIRWEAERNDIYLWHLRDRMSHIKAMLIDNKILILGSSNYDYISYKTQQELFAVITDEETVARFRKKVLDPDYHGSDLYYSRKRNLIGPVVYILMRTIGPLLVSLPGLSMRRTTE